MRLLVVLTSLRAEGTPVLTLEMCRYWLTWNIQPTIVILKPELTDLLEEFRMLGIQVDSINLPQKGYWRYVHLTTEIYRLSRIYKPDALLSMPLGWHTFIAYGAYLSGVRKMVAHVGNYPPFWKGTAFRKFRWEIQIGRPVTDVLICCSNYVRDGVIQHFKVNVLETATIYNGCPTERFINASLSDSKKQIQSNLLTISMVARLEMHKDQPTLIRAAQLLKKQGLNFRVWLIGNGSRQAEYEKLISEMNLEGHVFLLGMRRDIPALLSQTNVFAFSAKPDEGFGVALVEAMAAGVPVIATDVGACKEILENGQLGTLIPPDDPSSMATAISNIFYCRTEVEQRTERAREKAIELFSIERMASEYAKCLGVKSEKK